jgi:hypothetical protein
LACGIPLDAGDIVIEVFDLNEAALDIIAKV